MGGWAGHSLAHTGPPSPPSLPHTAAGQLGDVLEESARIALSWVRAHAAALGLPGDATCPSRCWDVHIHLPAGERAGAWGWRAEGLSVGWGVEEGRRLGVIAMRSGSFQCVQGTQHLPPPTLHFFPPLPPLPPLLPLPHRRGPQGRPLCRHHAGGGARLAVHRRPREGRCRHDGWVGGWVGVCVGGWVVVRHAEARRNGRWLVTVWHVGLHTQTGGSTPP